MKIGILILTCMVCFNASAAETDKPKEQLPQKQEQVKKDAPKKTATKKQPGTMEKAGGTLKSGWNKFTHDIKQGAKKPACTDAQRSMNQCK